MNLNQLKELKQKAQKTQAADEWTYCQKFLQQNPLSGFRTMLFEVQASARAFGLNIEEVGGGTLGKYWIISIPGDR